MLGGIFQFYSNFNRTLQANSRDPDQMLRSRASGLGLHYLPTSHKKDARLYGLSKLFITLCILVAHKCILWQTVKTQMKFHQGLHYLLRQ